MIKWKERAGWLALAVVAVLFALNFTPEEPPPMAVAVKPAPEVAKLPKVDVPVKKVKAYPQKAKAKLSLPEPAASSPSTYALASSRVAPNDRPTTVTSALDVESGEVTMYEKVEPLPWLALSRHGEAGIIYGLKNGEASGRVYVEQDLLNVKAFRLGVTATLDQNADHFIGAKFGLSW